jgi:hypothetical protein
MLRRGSKAKQQQQQQQAELERRERQAQMLPKQPPQLPSHQALPGMPSFGGDGDRPDSFAIFNNAYSHRAQPQPVNVRTTAPAQSAANFSRPGNTSMASAHRDNSSSPAYALRGASASVSPPPVKATPASNGDDLAERTASMTNRGRSTTQPIPHNQVTSTARGECAGGRTQPHSSEYILVCIPN